MGDYEEQIQQMRSGFVSQASVQASLAAAEEQASTAAAELTAAHERNHGLRRDLEVEQAERATLQSQLAAVEEAAAAASAANAELMEARTT